MVEEKRFIDNEIVFRVVKLLEDQLQDSFALVDVAQHSRPLL